MFIRLTLHRIPSSLRSVGGCVTRACGSFGREKHPSVHFCSSFSCSVTLSYLAHNLKSSHSESQCVSHNQDSTNTQKPNTNLLLKPVRTRLKSFMLVA